MDTLDLDMNKRYSYADYLTWMDGARRELLDGFIKLMIPAPSRRHQRISATMMKILGVYLKKNDVKFITLHRMCVCQKENWQKVTTRFILFYSLIFI